MTARSPTRARLPNRRAQVTIQVEWRGHPWIMSVGFAPDGRAGEVFVKGIKIGSAMDAIMDDACVLLSLLLQGGHRAGDLARHLGREGADPADPAASPLGMVASTCARIEAEVDA